MVGNCSEALREGAAMVLTEVRDEILSFQNSGMSLMEMSHRGSEYTKINTDAQKHIKQLLNVPDNYKIMFIQGGGTGAFAAVALNLLNRTGTADYIVTGTWSEKAAKEAAKYGKVNYVYPVHDKPGKIPSEDTWTMDPNASYLYFCDNETVDGVEFAHLPHNPYNVPLVTDMSSNIMTRKIDVSKFGCIFGGAQKNIGPAGCVVVIIREDLIGNAMPICPTIFDFKVVAKENSVHNTPATFSVYVMEKVLRWIIKNGGIEGMESQSAEKSKHLYNAMINSNGYYSCPIDENCRSRINIPFRVGGPKGDEALEAKFLEEAEKVHMYQLKGHRSVGGIRASLYNAVTLDEVKLLVQFMEEFRKRHQV